MKYVVIIMDETIWEFKEFKTKEEMEEYVYKHALDSCDIEYLREHEPNDAITKKLENKQGIYKIGFKWGENDRQTLFVLEVQDDGTWKKVI